MKKILPIFLFAITLLSCESTEKKAGKALLSRIEQSFDSKEYNTAKTQIDSINTLHRRNVELRKAANTYLYKIEKIEVERNLTYFQEELPRKEHQLDSMLTYFTLEKNADKNDPAYVHNSIRYVVDETFIKPQVKEDGELSMTSIFCGESDCPYQSVKLTSNGYFVLSSMTPAEGVSQNYTFKNGKNTWRMLVLSKKESEDLARFVTLYDDNNIQASLTGKGCNYQYTLDKRSKKAIKDSYYLSLLIKEISEQKRNIEIAKRKLIIIDKKIASQQ